MDYNYNVLMSLEQDAILIINGKYDTYPALILQKVKNTRPDVTLLNIDLLSNTEYRNRMFSKLGIKGTFKNDINKSRSAFFKELLENNPGKPVYFGLTVAPAVISLIKDKLYPTGLALKYSEQDFDNLSVLSKNWEDNFKKDYLKTLKKGNSLSEQLNSNYILPLLLLYKHYKETGKDKKMNEVLDILRNIAANSGREKILEQYLNE